MNLDRIKSSMPWWAKIAIKLVMSRIPTSYRIWQRLNFFKHGSMETPEYAYNVFRKHFDRSDFSKKDSGFVCLEIGPGDSLFSCLIAKSHGASSIYLIDAGPYALLDMAPYSRMISYLKDKGFNVSSLENVETVSALLNLCDCHYGTKGITSLAAIPSSSVDFIWSQAVLEHIRKDEFSPFLFELRRVLKDDGVCSHRVDLRDHLGGGLNNLRFSESLWESKIITNSGFYTNRIRFLEMCKLFKKAGFDTKILSEERWNDLPMKYEKLGEDFRTLPKEQLLTSGFDVLLKPLPIQINETN